MLRVHELAHDMTGGKPGRAVIVFPLNRPRRYLLDIYRKESKGPLLLPHIVNVSQLIETCMESWTRTVPRMAGTLDQVAVLKDCLLEIGLDEERETPLTKLARSLANVLTMTLVRPKKPLWNADAAFIKKFAWSKAKLSRQPALTRNFLKKFTP